MITCLKCRQEYSEPRHVCIETMTNEELFVLGVGRDADSGGLCSLADPGQCGVVRLLSRGETCAKAKGHDGHHDWW